MKPKRILYVIDDLWSSRGGSEQHLLWLLRTVPDSEFEKHFIIFSSLWNSEDVVLEKNPIILGQRFGLGCRSWPRRLRFLARYVRERDIELVHAFGAMGELVATLAAGSERRGRVIANRRDCGYDRRCKIRWIHWIGRRRGNRYIANSEAAKTAAFRLDETPLDTITVIRNPISTSRLDAALAAPWSRSELPISEEAKRGKLVGMVATVRPIKDYGTLIRAAEIVLKTRPETWFLCVGEQQPKYRTELEQLAGRLGVADRIVWYGPVDNPLALMPCFDVAVLSSRSESFSNTVLEYAVSERPIVVSDVGGLGEIVEDGRTGFLVPPENPEATAEKILQFLDDPELGRRFGQAAREFVCRQYDEKKILEQYLEYYRSFF